MIDTDKNPPVAVGLIFAVIYTLASLGLSFSYAVTPRVFPRILTLGFDLLGYISIFFLIFSTTDDLSNYYLDRFSLLALILFPSLFRPVPSQAPGWVLFLFLIIPMGLGIFLYLRVRQLEVFRRGKLLDLAKYLALGSGIAFLFFTLANLLGAANQITLEKLTQVNLLSFLNQLLASLSTNAAIEETLFRGFLLGFLSTKRE